MLFKRLWMFEKQTIAYMHKCCSKFTNLEKKKKKSYLHNCYLCCGTNLYFMSATRALNPGIGFDTGVYIAEILTPVMKIDRVHISG